MEYRPGFTVCSDCQVALVADPPRASSTNAPADVDSDKRSFTLIWSGSDARVHAEVCEALDRKGIPVRSLDTDDYLFNLTMRPAHQVYVPSDLVNSAREALKQVNAVEESLDQSESFVLELSAEEGPADGHDVTGDDGERDDVERHDVERADPLNFEPEDATVEIWSGQEADMSAMIASSLRENHIPYRRDPDMADPDSAEPKSAPKNAADEARPTRFLVLPEDEKQAKAIVREIVDAVPPD